MAEVKEIRGRLIAKRGKCMICGHSPRMPHKSKPVECSQLCCHEIANGPNRDKALDKPYAILVLCWWCNGQVVTDKRAWPEARQLGLLRRLAPEDFDLPAFNRLVNPRAPHRITMEEIECASVAGEKRIALKSTTSGRAPRLRRALLIERQWRKWCREFNAVVVDKEPTLLRIVHEAKKRRALQAQRKLMGG